jgi:hypothetical protein
MLNVLEATKIINEALPTREIGKPIDYRGLYIFLAIDNHLPIEGDMDPYFSVNKETGELRDYSIIADGDISEIVALFEKEKMPLGGEYGIVPR